MNIVFRRSRGLYDIDILSYACVSILAVMSLLVEFDPHARLSKNISC